jgi:hypothetical protein
MSATPDIPTLRTKRSDTEREREARLVIDAGRQILTGDVKHLADDIEASLIRRAEAAGVALTAIDRIELAALAVTLAPTVAIAQLEDQATAVIENAVARAAGKKPN